MPHLRLLAMSMVLSFQCVFAGAPRQSAQGMVDSAVALAMRMGPAAAIRAVAKGDRAFNDGERYVFVYDTNGMVMALVALFNQQPKATDDEIKHALSGHLCRCGTHVEIMQAAARARELIAQGHSPAIPAAGASTQAKAA